MNIAVNTRLLIKNRLEGIGTYTFETLARITKMLPNYNFYFIFDRDYPDEFIFEKNIIPIVLRPSARHPILWFIWFEILLPKVLKKIKADLFLSPEGMMPHKLKIPSITVIHDINFEYFPRDTKFLHSIYYRFFFKKYAHNSSKIITVSNFSKKDIISKYNINKDKISYAYNGINKIYKPLKSSIKTKKKYSDNEDYFLFVGSINPRKNLNNLILAFNLFKNSSNCNTKLIIVGRIMYWDSKINKSYKSSKYKDDIIFLGEKNNFELVNIYSSALAFCFLSYFEGFGIPIIEAMKCGCPVIASNQTVIPEITQKAAVLVNPFNLKEISNQMMKIKKDINHRKFLSQMGIEQSKKYNWDDPSKLIVSKILELLKC